MSKLYTRRVLTLLSALSLSTSTAWPQAVRNTDAAPQPDSGSRSEREAVATTSAESNADMLNEEPVLLDPFTVTTDHEGYKAIDTLAGGRVRTTLRDTPAALSVVTKKLMDDLAVTNAEDLLIYTNNTEVAGLGGNFSGLASRGTGADFSGIEGNRLVNPAGVNRARGLSAMDNTRNYMPSDIPWDGFNISRVDISRGPNSFLFGVGSPSGISNVSTNEATFSDKGSFEARIGSFGSTREALDYNKVLLPQELAIRFDVVNDEAEFRQKPAFSHSKRAYGAIRFDPKFLRTDSAHTKIQANFEYGRVNSNNPRMLPPLDYLTGYLNDPQASANGYNPWLYRNDNSNPPATASYWSNHGSLRNEYQWDTTPNYYWDATTGSILRASQGGYSQPPGGDYNAGLGLNNNIYHITSRGFSNFARASNYYNPAIYKGAYQGTVNYFDQTLSDRSIFDYENKLIDGNNKREWQRWNAAHVSVIQSLFDSRLVIQAVADRQEYRNGQAGYLSSGTPIITLDLDQYLLAYPSWFPQAQANPNLGRPVTFGGAGKGEENRSKRDNYQVTAAWNLNIERDFGAKGLLARILGSHDITGLGSQYTHERSNESYKLNGIDPAFTMAYQGKTKLNQNDMSWLAYLGPSLLGTTGAGSNLSALSMSITPTPYPMTVYRPVWTAASSVDPTAPWSYTVPNGATVTQTQAQNPANYMGYVGLPAGLLNSSANMDQLRTGSSINEQRITSEAFMYQGHLWDDTIIPSFGWRRDTTRQRGDVAEADSVTGFYRKLAGINDTGVEATVISKSYGVAIHLPKFIKKNLPEGTDLSFYYFHGSNETPKVRYAVDGSQLPNESGETDDFAVQYDGLDGRLTVRLTYFKTVSKNAAASYGQPLGASTGWKIDAMPSWTLGFAASALAARDAAAAGTPLPSDFPTWMTGWGDTRPAVLADIEQAMKTDFVEMFPQDFWDKYGYTVDVEAIKRGDWMNVTTSNPWPSPWTLGGDPSHRIHGEYAVIDQDIEAKGYELEATFRPLRNWDITLNASKADAKQIGLGQAAADYLNGMAELFLDGPLGKVAVWGGYTDFGATKQDFLQSLWAPYLQQVSLTGSDQPEWRKIRFNVISNYRFDRGALRGLNVGGAFRWQDKAIAGYGIHEAVVYGESAWITDVNQPIYSPTDEHFDAWIGYERKLTPKINWRVQLNLRNVGEKAGLVPITYQPDGTVAQSRIAEGQTYELSMKFIF